MPPTVTPLRLSPLTEDGKSESNDLATALVRQMEALHRGKRIPRREECLSLLRNILSDTHGITIRCTRLAVGARVPRSEILLYPLYMRLHVASVGTAAQVMELRFAKRAKVEVKEAIDLLQIRTVARDPTELCGADASAFVDGWWPCSCRIMTASWCYCPPQSCLVTSLFYFRV